MRKATQCSKVDSCVVARASGKPRNSGPGLFQNTRKSRSFLCGFSTALLLYHSPLESPRCCLLHFSPIMEPLPQPKAEAGASTSPAPPRGEVASPSHRGGLGSPSLGTRGEWRPPAYSQRVSASPYSSVPPNQAVYYAPYPPHGGGYGNPSPAYYGGAGGSYYVPYIPVYDDGSLVNPYEVPHPSSHSLVDFFSQASFPHTCCSPASFLNVSFTIWISYFLRLLGILTTSFFLI